VEHLADLFGGLPAVNQLPAAFTNPGGDILDQDRLAFDLE